jgi:hypothetical protein
MWYCAKLYYKIIPDNDQNASFVEESYILIDAKDRQDAGVLAADIGLKSEHSYISSSDETLNVTFMRINEIYEILDEVLGSGTEVFSRFLDTKSIPEEK